MELVRLAFPRRIYTQSHVDYLAEVIIAAYKQSDKLGGYKIISGPWALRQQVVPYLCRMPTADFKNDRFFRICGTLFDFNNISQEALRLFFCPGLRSGGCNTGRKTAQA